MKRRNFIKVLGLGTGAVAVSSSVISCSSKTTQFSVDNLGWDDPRTQFDDIRLQLIAYAMLSPNPHNIQPWLVKLTGSNSFDLYVDQQRLLPETDPLYRQIHIGQGTFLETLEIAGSGLGYQVNIQYFPQGMYGNHEIENKPVASIELIKNSNIDIDPLFSQVLKRHSNKREYNNQRISSGQKSKLEEMHRQKSISELMILQKHEAKVKLERILTDAMAIEVGNRKRDLETIKMFRFDDDEVAKYRDGFGVAQSGVTGIRKFIAESFFLSRDATEKDPTSFGEQAVEMVKKAAESTATFAWLSTASNSRLDQIKVGRDYCRINLHASLMGLVQHPMSQILQEYKDMLPLQNEFKQHFGIATNDTVQMLFRLGTAEATAHSPRRAVYSIIDDVVEST